MFRKKRQHIHLMIVNSLSDDVLIGLPICALNRRIHVNGRIYFLPLSVLRSR